MKDLYFTIKYNTIRNNFGLYILNELNLFEI